GAVAETGKVTAAKNGSCEDWARNARFTGVDTYDPVRYAPGDFAAVCGFARQRALACAPAASPGFQAIRSSAGANTIVVPRNDGARYDSQWQGVIAAAPDFAAITSYNEWHEGSQT